MERIQPFLKWAGGKFKLIDKITGQFPSCPSTRYIEPFVGAGALALNVNGFSEVVINDNNADLINVWMMIQNQPEDLIKQCQQYFSGSCNNETEYYRIRDAFNDRTLTDKVVRAAQFIYFNKHGFNGLCRYNSKGGFNVPFGRYSGPTFDADKIRLISSKISDWFITACDFRTIMNMAGEGDVCYCDPPYVTDKEVENGFTSYSAGGFKLEDQITLSLAARKASECGAHVIVSNHDTEFTQNQYLATGADIVRFEVQRNISCDGKNRKKAGELLAVYSPMVDKPAGNHILVA
jgi:DNA adenine methylase